MSTFAPSTTAPRPWYRNPLGLSILAVVLIAFFGYRNYELNRVGTRHYLVGSDAPNFELPVPGSDTPFRLDDHRGKVILVDFWATWCVPCQRQSPALRSINGHYSGDEFVLIGVNTDESDRRRAHKVHDYLIRHHLTAMTVAFDDNRTQVLYDVQSIPTMILIGADGKVKRVFRGVTTRSILERAIEIELKARTKLNASAAN